MNDFSIDKKCCWKLTVYESRNHVWRENSAEEDKNVNSIVSHDCSPGSEFQTGEHYSDGVQKMSRMFYIYRFFIYESRLDSSPTRKFISIALCGCHWFLRSMLFYCLSLLSTPRDTKYAFWQITNAIIKSNFKFQI